MVPIRAQETHADTDRVSTDLVKTDWMNADLGNPEPVEASLVKMDLAKTNLAPPGLITPRERRRSLVGLELPFVFAPVFAPFRLMTPRTVLRWAEYGVALGAIIGTMTATITGQLVFAVTPLSLAISLNLWRRQLSDQVLLQESEHNGQLILHHFHDALNTFEQEHHQFLLNHAGQFQPQEQPLVFQALQQSVFKLEAHADAIQGFWQKQAQAERQSLDQLRSNDEACWQALETLFIQIEDRWSSPQLEELTDYVQQMGNKVSQISRVWQPFLSDDALVRAEAASLLRDDLQSVQAVQSQLEGLKHQWEGWVESQAQYFSDWAAKIDQGIAPIHQQLIALAQTLDLRSPSLPSSILPTGEFLSDPSAIADASKPIQAVLERLTNHFNAAWDHWATKRVEFHEGLNLLHGQINALTTPIADLDQQILAQNVEIMDRLAQAQFESQLPGQMVDQQTDFQSLKQLEFDLDAMRQDLLQAIAQHPYSQAQATILAAQQTLSSQLAGLKDQLNVFGVSPLNDLWRSQLNELTSSVLRLENQLNQLLGLQSWESNDAVEKIQAQIKDLETTLNSLRAEQVSVLAKYNSLYVKTSLLRFKINELSAQISIELEQLPNLIDNAFRNIQRRSILEGLTKK